MRTLPVSRTQEIAALFDPATNPIRAPRIRTALSDGTNAATGRASSGAGASIVLRASEAAREAADKVVEDDEEDPSYEAMLARARRMMRAHNPGMDGIVKKLVLRPPLVSRVGSTRSNWSNFGQIVALLHRDMDHVRDYFLAELGTTASLANMARTTESLVLADEADALEAEAKTARAKLDASAEKPNRAATAEVESLEARARRRRAEQIEDQKKLELGAHLMLKGRHQANSIEQLLRKYIKAYVICDNCRSSDTVMVKNSAMRISTLQCRTCRSTRTVAAIQGGFSIVKRGQRRKERAAALS